MKTHRAAMCLAVAAVAIAASRLGAESPEAALGSASQALSGASLAALQARRGFEKAWAHRPQRPPRKLWETPKITPAPPNLAGPLLGSFTLAERLDIHRNLLNRQLGAQAWDISMASDPEFKV